MLYDVSMCIVQRGECGCWRWHTCFPWFLMPAHLSQCSHQFRFILKLPKTTNFTWLIFKGVSQATLFPSFSYGIDFRFVMKLNSNGAMCNASNLMPENSSKLKYFCLLFYMPLHLKMKNCQRMLCALLFTIELFKVKTIFRACTLC